MKIITVEMIMEKKPCPDWTEERVRQYIGKGKTLKEILQIKGVDPADKIWCAANFLPDETNKKFIIWCVEQCKTDDKKLNEYIKTVKRFYTGQATSEELRITYGATVWADDWTDVWEIGGEAYWAADWVSDWADDSAAERNKQIEKLLTLL
jgi:hypothetical protein